MPPELAPLESDSSFTPAKMYLWVKNLESKVNNLLREVEVLKNDFITKQNSLKRELRTAAEDQLELKHQQDKFLQKTDLIIRELQQTASSQELTTLQKYVDLWNPLNFVTQRDVARIVEDHLGGVQKVLKRHIYVKKAARRRTQRRHYARKKLRSIKKHKRKVIHHAN